MSKLHISAIILASGFSRRYGNENKLMTDYLGRPLIEHVVDTVVSSKLFTKVIVVTQYDEIKRTLAHYDDLEKKIEIVKNTAAEEGISQSIRLGVLASRNMAEDNITKGVDGYMFIQGDQPLLSERTLTELVTAFEQNSSNIIVPVYKGQYGSPKVFSSRFRSELLELKGDVGGKQLIQCYSECMTEVAIERDYENRDIDSKEDYIEMENGNR